MVPVSYVEDMTGLLGSLAAGGALAGVVERLLVRLPIIDQDHHHDKPEAHTVNSGDEDSIVGGAGSADDEGLLAGGSGDGAALVTGAERHRVVLVEEASASGIMGPGAVGLGELVAAYHRLTAWALWGQLLAAAYLTARGKLSSHPGR